MKLETIILGRSIRLMRINQPPGGIHMQRVVEAMREKYEFLEVPKTLAEYDETKGIFFRHGKFTVTQQGKKKEIIVDLSVYSDGVIGDTRSYTDDADNFIDDVIQFCVKTFGVTVPPNQQIEKYYLSNLEVSLASQLDSFCSVSSFLSKQLSGCLTRYGIKHHPFELAGLMMNFDKKTFPSLLTNYTLQRREGAPFNSKLYFSSAPLTTEDHLSLLQLLDVQASR